MVLVSGQPETILHKRYWRMFFTMPFSSSHSPSSVVLLLRAFAMRWTGQVTLPRGLFRTDDTKTMMFLFLVDR